MVLCAWPYRRAGQRLRVVLCTIALYSTSSFRRGFFVKVPERASRRQADGARCCEPSYTGAINRQACPFDPVVVCSYSCRLPGVSGVLAVFAGCLNSFGALPEQLPLSHSHILLLPFLSLPPHLRQLIPSKVDHTRLTKIELLDAGCDVFHLLSSGGRI